MGFVLLFDRFFVDGSGSRIQVVVQLLDVSTNLSVCHALDVPREDPVEVG